MGHFLAPLWSYRLSNPCFTSHTLMACTAARTCTHTPPTPTSGMIDGAFTATHRLFSHPDCPTNVCVYVCVCSMWGFLMCAVGTQLCFSLLFIIMVLVEPGRSTQRLKARFKSSWPGLKVRFLLWYQNKRQHM